MLGMVGMVGMVGTVDMVANDINPHPGVAQVGVVRNERSGQGPGHTSRPEGWASLLLMSPRMITTGGCRFTGSAWP